MERRRLRAPGLSFWLSSSLAASPLGCASSLEEARRAEQAVPPDYEGAQAHYREAMERPTQAAAARRELGTMLRARARDASQRDDHESASAFYAEALEVDPADTAAGEGLARALAELGRTDAALQAAERAIARGCTSCERLRAALWIRRGNERAQQGQWPQAEQDYVAAMEVLPDASLSLALVRCHYAQRDLDGAVAALRHAQALLGPQDVRNQQHFLELRRAVALLALHQQRIPLADELLDAIPQGVAVEDQIGLALEVSLEFQRAGYPELGVRRLSRLHAAAQAGEIQLDEAEQVELRERLAALYGDLALQRGRAGDLEAAGQVLAEGLALEPRNPGLLLRAALLDLARGDRDGASARLAEVDRGAEGYREVAAIVAAWRAVADVEGGRVRPARASLEQAQALAPSLPEVHVATAYVLAVSPVTGLSKREERWLREASAVAYPGQHPVRVGEALSELAWAARQATGLGPQFPYRALDLERTAASLSARLRQYFPFTVEFHPEPTAQVRLHNRGAAPLGVAVTHGDTRTQLEVAPGASHDLELRPPVVLGVAVDQRTRVVIAEPYTRLEIDL